MVDGQGVRTWLESTKQKGMALGLQNTALAIAEMDLPRAEYETVHVAGSNGKGTTVATLGAALGLANIDHVSFTSPHLVRVEERIRFNGCPVSVAQFDEALAAVHGMVEHLVDGRWGELRQPVRDHVFGRALEELDGARLDLLRKPLGAGLEVPRPPRSA